LILYNTGSMYFQHTQNKNLSGFVRLHRSMGLCALLFLYACSTASYKPDIFDPDRLRVRAETQTFGDLSVSAAVPGDQETQEIFGLPLYKRGVQPVWLEIENRGDNRARLAMVSLDRDYFSPLEVSYTHRKGFSKSARDEMDQRFFNMSMARDIDPGETESGFVFTHLNPGTKSFNVDLFGGNNMQNFAFFIDVPGFIPDHAKVDFKSLYPETVVRNMDTQALRTELSELSCCTNNPEGEASGLPLNIILVGKGRDILRALLRANWYETLAGSNEIDSDKLAYKKQSPYHLYGRKPDAIFRIKRDSKDDRNELRLWLSPMQLDGESVWLGQVTNFVGQRTYIEQVLFGAHLDPDIDDARGFFLQNIWYSQGLEAFAWQQGPEAIPVSQPAIDFNGNQYFTDGHRLILWLSGTPYSMTDSRNLHWDENTLQ
jgi:hypothetical protein